MKRLKVFSWILFIALAAVIILNRQTVYDFVRGLFYTPTPEMAQIRDDLGLTSRGEIIFNASQPSLNTKEEFNEKCRDDDITAILGCYTEQTIYVYNITDKELDGILELTTAHELLHAVYERMSIADRDNLRALLEKTYSENQEVLKEEIEAYDAVDQLEEVYVRVGTEVKKLPEELEKHYAEIFKDQDKVVDYYNKYIKVFREIEDEFKKLEDEMKQLDTEIDTKTDNYENGLTVLNAEIDKFNACANTPGCFNSEYEFSVKREELVYRQTVLQSLYDEIDGLINQYNTDVEKFNNNIIRSEKLQNIINSYERVEEL